MLFLESLLLRKATQPSMLPGKHSESLLSEERRPSMIDFVVDMA